MSDNTLLDNFSSLVAELNETKGTNNKIEVLKSYPNCIELIKRLKDETVTDLGIKSIDNYKKKSKKVEPHPGDFSIVDLYDMLVNRDITGDLAISTVLAYIKQYPSHEQTIIGFLTKTTRLNRIGKESIIKAFPGTFNMFEVALAETYNEDRYKRELTKTGNAWISKKIDGVRLITIIKGAQEKKQGEKDIAKLYDINFYSRLGNKFTSLNNLRPYIHDIIKNNPQIENYWNEGIVLDGEFIVMNNGKEDFNLAVGQIKRIKEQVEKPYYIIFDMMKLSVFNKEEQGDKTEERYKLINKTIPNEYDSISDNKNFPPGLYRIKQHSYKNIDTLKKRASDEGWEGIMIRFNDYYKPKRSYNIMKWKLFQDDEYEVKDVEIKDMPFVTKSGGEEFLRALNSIIIHVDKGCIVNVGSGFSKEERLKYAKNPDLIIGKIVKIKYQEKLYDVKTQKHSLRMPIFVGFRPSKDT